MIPQSVEVKNKIYAGIGSQQFDAFFNESCVALGRYLASQGLTLRSGATKGCCKAFERGCDVSGGKKEIIIPHCGFEGSNSNFVIPPCSKAFKVVSQIHGHWNKCSPASKRLLACEVLQVLGLDLEHPVDFVVCWTPYGKEVGGTRIATTIARMHKIPIFNLNNYSISDVAGSLFFNCEKNKKSEVVNLCH